MAHILPMVQGAFILGGEFNAVMNPSIERWHGSRYQPPFLKERVLFDRDMVQRQFLLIGFSQIPFQTCYVFYISRLFFTSQDLLNKTTIVTYLQSAISNHLPVEFVFVSRHRDASIWCMSLYWLMEPMVLYTCVDAISHYWLENSQGVSNLVSWDTFKAVMWVAYMTRVTALIKANGNR